MSILGREFLFSSSGICAPSPCSLYRIKIAPFIEQVLGAKCLIHPNTDDFIQFS